MTPNDAFSDSLGYLVARVCKLHRNRASSLLDAVGLYVGQEMILARLCEKEGVTQTELAEHLLVQAATMTNMLKRMERRGLVERRQDLDDQRVSRVYLTEQGRGLEPAIDKAWGQLEEEALAGFSLEERELLRRLLMQVYDNLAHAG